MKKFLALLLLIVVSVAVMAEKELYAVLSDSTLTIYYDANRASKGGVTEWWNVSNMRIKANEVIFDASVAAARPTSTAKWFCDFYKVTTINGLSYLNTSEVTRMDSMFAVNNGLTSLDVSSFHTEKVTNMSGMFQGCTKLTELDLSNFNTSKVTDMSEMFVVCEKLTSVNLSSFNTENVTDMSEMFEWCMQLTELDLSNFNTSKVTDMSEMFADCENLETIYCDDDWGASATLTNSKGMFDGCVKLKGGAAENPTEYNSEKTDAEYARPDKPSEGQPGYFTIYQGIPDTNPILALDTIQAEPNKETAITFTLDGPSSSAVLLSLQAEDSYDESQQCVVLRTTLYDANVVKLMDNILKNVGGFASVFSGVSFFLPAGSGEMKLDICTYGMQLSVHIGNSGVAHLTQNKRGEAVVQYDIKEPTLVCIHASVPENNQARQRAPQQTNEEKQVDIYGIKLLPKQVITGMENVQSANVQCTKVVKEGKLYLMYEGRMYDVQGRMIK